MECNHDILRCLGPYSTFRKYLCESCGGVYICKCEREIAEIFLPHQTRVAIELGTGVDYQVTGFAPNICNDCRGENEFPYPKIYGGIVDRFYWRDINKTYYSLSLEWLKKNDHKVKNIMDFESKHPKVAASLNKEAKQVWKKIHKSNPKYDTIELIDSTKMEKVESLIVHIDINSKWVKKRKNSKTQWEIDEKKYETIEQATAHHYRNQGYRVWHNEKRLISTLIGVFGSLAPHYNPGINLEWKHLTNNWEERKKLNNSDLLKKHIRHGSREYYLRQELEVSNLRKKLEKTDDHLTLFDSLVKQENEPTQKLRMDPRPWNRFDIDEYGLQLTRDFIKNTTKKTLLNVISYALYYFYGHRMGWPEYFAETIGKELAYHRRGA